MKVRLTGLMLPLLLSLPLACAAQEREWASYKKLVETLKLDKFYALPANERDKMQLYARLTPVNKNIAPSSVKLAVVHSGGRQPIPLDAGGRAIIVPNRAFIAEDAKIWTSLPKEEKMNVSFDAGAILPQGQQWNYATVMGSLPQANKVVKKLAGAFSLFIPTMNMVIFKFDKPAQLTIHARSGDQHHATDGKNQIRLKLDDTLLAENPQVNVSQQPLEAEIDSD